ncbi:unnamed protein product [Urochloa humidicola]
MNCLELVAATSGHLERRRRGHLELGDARGGADEFFLYFEKIFAVCGDLSARQSFAVCGLMANTTLLSVCLPCAAHGKCFAVRNEIFAVCIEHMANCQLQGDTLNGVCC